MIRLKSAALFLSAMCLANSYSFSKAGDLSGTYLDPALQRPDIFSHHVWKNWPEYRAVYNRPRYVGGQLAAIVEPSSQEAMAWKENVRLGNYENCRGPYVPHYCYPKPWEALNTKARADNKPQKDTIKVSRAGESLIKTSE